MAGARIVMKTLSLPEGNAFGVDDIARGTPIVNSAQHRAKTLFFVWATLTEHKWVIFGERRGFCSHTLIDEDRVSVRVHNDEAGWPRCRLVRLLLQLHSLSPELAL